ncbi:hypothetical protein ODJ79_30065 [Actinoplanes sp. KI2]|uniref:hypothetical protein n=1 Tax=Actinoplanes sp. KI2 TaxID=2983315 RepID=UPI0021D5C2E3|nr:hypothetical protein [Actinoplanes sp. KI2]MCU7727985.1 hypothetical protein [Actinoplanes sp. KI2]
MTVTADKREKTWPPWSARGSPTVYFGVLGAIAIVIGLLLWLISKPLQRLMSGFR